MSLETLTQNEPAKTAPANGEVVVAVRGLTKVFKDFWGRPKARAVDNVNFEVRRGEVFGLGNLQIGHPSPLIRMADQKALKSLHALRNAF